MANKAYVYRIYPDQMQEQLMQKTFGCCRFVYNSLLTLQEERYRSGEKHLSKTEANTYCNKVLSAVIRILFHFSGKWISLHLPMRFFIWKKDTADFFFVWGNTQDIRADIRQNGLIQPILPITILRSVKDISSFRNSER